MRSKLGARASISGGMNPYREPPPKLESNHAVFLSPAGGEHSVPLRLFTYIVLLPLVFAVPAVVRGLLHGWGSWTQLGWVGVLLLPPLVLARARVRGGILIGPGSVRRVGFWRERATTWEQLAAVAEGSRSGLGNTEGPALWDELERAQLFVRDPSGMLGWTLDAVRDGRVAEIAERVHREGRPPRRWRWYVPDAVGVLALILLLSVRPALAIQREAAWAEHRAEVAACMASYSGTEATTEGLRLLCR